MHGAGLVGISADLGVSRWSLRGSAELVAIRKSLVEVRRLSLSGIAELDLMCRTGCDQWGSRRS